MFVISSVLREIFLRLQYGRMKLHTTWIRCLTGMLVLWKDAPLFLKRGESMPDAKKDDLVEIKVGFNQQQRQLIEKIKNETDMGKTDAEVIRTVFVQWLKEEGLL